MFAGDGGGYPQTSGALRGTRWVALPGLPLAGCLARPRRVEAGSKQAAGASSHACHRFDADLRGTAPVKEDTGAKNESRAFNFCWYKLQLTSSLARLPLLTAGSSLLALLRDNSEWAI